MNNKRINTANVNFILILSIILVIVSFSLSNLNKFNKGEKLLNEFDSNITFYEEEISSDKEKDVEEWKSFTQDLSQFGIDAGNVGLDVLRIFFVWIPLFHIFFLLLFAGIAWMLFRPTDNRVLAYRILMTFAYLNILVIIAVLFFGILIHYSTMKKIKMFIFAVQCLGILIFNFRNTYSKRIKTNLFYNKKSDYNKANQIPVVRASICTGEKVAGFKDINSGKFIEVMLIKNDKDMNLFLDQYHIEMKDVKKEW